MDNMITVPDSDLIIACRKGDLRAFEVLIARYQQVVYQDTLRYLHDPEQAKDAAQDTFMAAFRQLVRLDDTRKFGSWLRGIARHRCLNLIRTNHRAATAYQQWQTIQVDTTTPDSDYDDNSTDVIYNLLNHLPDKSVQVVFMHYVADLPVATIAQRLSMSSPAVKQRLYRARQHIHEEVLVMMKDMDKRAQLPAGFPSRVIAKILEEAHQNQLHMRYKQAQDQLQKAFDAAPDHIDVMLAYGTSYDPVCGKASQHIDVLERAAEQVPDSIPVFSALALAYWVEGKKAEWDAISQVCINLCDRRLEANPNDLEALKGKADILRFKKDYKATEQLLRRAYAEDHENPTIIHALGHNLSLQGRHDEAAPLYKKNITRYPDTQWAYFAFRQLSTDLAFRANDGKNAVNHMESAWQLTKRPNEAGNLISFYIMSDQLDDAVTLFETEDVHRHPRTLMTVGMGYAQRTHWKQAAVLFQEAIENTSDDQLRHEACIHLSAILIRDGQEKDALPWLENGLQLDLDHRSSLLTGQENSAFWIAWTKKLAESLEVLLGHDERVESLIKTVKKALGD